MLQIDRLSALPTEIFLMVWDNLDRDTDKSCLALTCKANANFYETNKDPNARIQPASPMQKVNFMKRMRGSVGRKHLRLCFTCGKYMPVRGEWHGRSGYDKLKLLTKKLQCTTGPRCELSLIEKVPESVTDLF